MNEGTDGSAPVIYDTGISKWRYGEKRIERWYGTSPFYREMYGPCPACGYPTMDYGGGWSCNAIYCAYSSHSFTTSAGPAPKWWNTDIRVKLDGDSWCAFRVPFTNLQECPAGFGDTPQKAVDALLAEGPAKPEQIPPGNLDVTGEERKIG